MTWLLIAIIGAIIGWLTGYAMSPDRRMNVLLNLIVGAVGAMLGVWFFAGVLGLMTASVGINFWLAIVWSIVGALIFMAVISALFGWAFHRRTERVQRYDTRMGRGVPHEYEKDEYKETTYRRRKK